MSETTEILANNQRFLESAGATVDRILKGKESAGLTKEQVKKMTDTGACPTCGKRLTALEQEHLSGSTSASESAGQGATGDVKLRESTVRSYMALGLPRAGAEAAADRGTV